MPGFNSQELIFEFEGREYKTSLDNDKMRLCDRVASGLSMETKDADDVYDSTHNETRECIVGLFGEDAYKQIFGDRPAFVFDDLAVLEALTAKILEFSAARLNAAYGPASVIKPQ